jgi:iron complex outermembrane receptor protein
MSKTTFKLKSLAIAVAVSNMAAISANAEDRTIEKIVVTAEKRGES